MSTPILSVEGLEKSYETADGKVDAVNGISFDAERGEIVGLLGPNGAGKTTTIKCILGLVRPTAGSIRINDIDPTSDKAEAYHYLSAVLEGARNVYWRLTVRENLRFFAGVHGKHPNDLNDRYEDLISLVGLEGKGDVQVRRLSRGMQQKASIATALIQQTPLLFLDEPTLGLDVEAAVDLKDEIHRLATEENRTIFLSSHNMNVIQELCDRVIIMNGGKIVANDTIENLVGVFETQTYEVTFEDEMPSTTSLDRFSVNIKTDRAYPTMEITLDGSKDLYEFIDLCRHQNVSIDRIESIQPDLEEVFLDVISTPEDEPRARQGGEA